MQSSRNPAVSRWGGAFCEVTLGMAEIITRPGRQGGGEKVPSLARKSRPPGPPMETQLVPATAFKNPGFAPGFLLFADVRSWLVTGTWVVPMRL
jgi:hypothetical protein